MLLINLAQSLFFLLLAGLIVTVAAPRFGERLWLRQILIGVLFAAGAMISMANPFVLQPGLVVDSRNSFAILAGPLGGPVAAILTGVPLTVMRYLSGGVDSAYVLATASRLRGKPLPSFTVRVPESQFDETALSMRLSTFTRSRWMRLSSRSA